MKLEKVVSVNYTRSSSQTKLPQTNLQISPKTCHDNFCLLAMCWSFLKLIENVCHSETTFDACHSDT